MSEKTGNAAQESDGALFTKVIESIVMRGDVSALGPTERANYYKQMCGHLGLNPHAQPFAFLRLNGKEILYATRGATDQLAAIHRLNREIVDGPKVIDLAGTKLVYAVCRATHPNGRVETATATVPLTDPVNVLMKAETKAKRRATLSILGLGLLDEMELETIPANAQEPGGGVDLSQANHHDEAERPEPPPADVHPALEAFYSRVNEIELPGEGVSVWMKHRAELGQLGPADRESAWKALCKKVEDVGKMRNAKVWLKKAIAEEDNRRGVEPEEPPPDGTTGGRTARPGAANTNGPTVVAAGTTSGPTSLARSLATHLASKPRAPIGDARAKTRELAEVANSYLKRRAEYAATGCADEALDVVRDELRARGCADPDALLQGVAEHVGHRRTPTVTTAPRKAA